MAEDQLLALVVGEDPAPVYVPAAEVRRLTENMGRTSYGASEDGSSAVEARRLLEDTLARPSETCKLEGSGAWEVLWAIQSLPDADVSPTLDVLRARLWKLTAGRRPRTPSVPPDRGAVQRLR